MEDCDCDKLCELLSLLTTKEEQIMKLDGGIEEKSPTEELEAEIESVQEYQGRIIRWKSRPKGGGVREKTRE